MLNVSDSGRSVTHDAFGNTLMIEVEVFFAEVEVFHRHGAAWADAEVTLIV